MIAAAYSPAAFWPEKGTEKFGVSVWIPEGRTLGASSQDDPWALYKVKEEAENLQQPEWLRLVRRRIGVVLSLRSGWDGVGSPAIDRLLAFRAERTLESALRGCRDPVAPFVVPSSDGSIQFEWRAESTRFEFYFDAGGGMSAWAQNRESGYEVEADGVDAIELLRRWSSRLRAKVDKSPPASVSQEISSE